MSDGETENGERERARPLRVALARGARAGVPRPSRPLAVTHRLPPRPRLVDRPAVITGAFDDWPAMERWNLDYLADAMGDAKVSVNVTPDGRGDASPRTAGPCRAWGDEIARRGVCSTRGEGDQLTGVRDDAGDADGGSRCERARVPPTRGAVRVEAVRQPAESSRRWWTIADEIPFGRGRWVNARTR